ncbi:hypothetical protein Droror1_Dr00010293 [Drosera rotundifolia]
MATLFSLILFLLFLPSPPLSPSTAAPQHPTQPPRLLDIFIRDYTIKHSPNTSKTGVPYPVPLPSDLSDIAVTITRFRCGSLSRYGALINQFRVPIGVTIHPCVERLVVITENLGQSYSSLYYHTFNFNGYVLITPILGLLAYNAGDDTDHKSNPFELKIMSGAENPIKINFTGIVKVNSTNWKKSQQPYCATFENDGSNGNVGRVELVGMVGEYVCGMRKGGHYGLVVEVEVSAVQVEMKREKGWKVAVGSVIGAVLGAGLLGLLVVAMVARVKKREKMEDMLRKAYEEEALQVSMVGHVRAPTAARARTWPTLEHHPRAPASV